MLIHWSAAAPLALVLLPSKGVADLTVVAVIVNIAVLGQNLVMSGM